MRLASTTRIVGCQFLAACVSFISSVTLSAQGVQGIRGTAESSAVVNFLQSAQAAPPGTVAGSKLVPKHRLRQPQPVVPSTLAARQSAQSLSAPAAPQAASPAATWSFAALGDDGTAIPPDTNGAVGPNHLMVALNSQVRILSKSGATISTQSLNAFWAALGGNPNAFDPRLAYDPYGNRWMFSAAANRAAANSKVLIGVSQTSDPTGNWNLFAINADPSGQVYADFPCVGFNKNWIVVTAYLYDVSGDAAARAHIYVFDKAKLYNGTSSYTLFQETNIANQSPALVYDNTISTMYLLESWDSSVGSLRLSTITGAVGSETYNAGVAFPISNSWSSTGAGGSDFAPQLGSTRKIDTGDDRILRMVYRNGSLWATHTVFLPAGAPTRSSVKWWRLDTSGGVQESRLFDDSTATNFYAFPTIAVNQNNDVLIGYSKFSASIYASAAYRFRAGIDTVFGSESVFKAGQAPYYKSGGGNNRWGDYSATCVDPSNDTDLWTIQEYAAPQVSGSSKWGTWWAGLQLTPPLELKGGDVLITFPTVFGKTYLVEYSTNLLSGSWSPLANNLPGNGGNLTVTDTNAASLPSRFYRVKVLP